MTEPATAACGARLLETAARCSLPAGHLPTPHEPAAPWMQRFKPDFDVFAGNPLVACECGWSWDAADGADTLADAVTACKRHVEEEHADV